MRHTAATDPPSRASWLIESETVGHRPSETLRYLAQVADHEDRQAERARADSSYIVTAPAPWWRKLRWLW
jgi:hypothetical protein